VNNHEGFDAKRFFDSLALVTLAILNTKSNQKIVYLRAIFNVILRGDFGNIDAILIMQFACPQRGK